MNKLQNVKHNVFGDIMFIFFIKIAVYLLLFLIVYKYYNKNKINILNFLIMLFLLNIYIIFLDKDINIFIGMLVTLIIFFMERFYSYLFLKNNSEYNKDRIFIKNGNICFKNLVTNKYPYHKLIDEIKRKGVKDISKIDYCILYNDSLVIFSDNINNYPVNLIIDGKIIDNNLYALKKSKEWLMNNLSKNNLMIKDVSYAFYKDNEIYFLTYV